MTVDALRRNLSQVTSELTKLSEKLASGKRLNRASDDPAGLAIVSQLVSDEKVSAQASNNVDYGRSVADIQDAAVSQLSDISTRQAELAAQSANGTLSDDQRVALNNEYQALGQEAQRISASTQFNGVNPLQNGVNLQVGNDSSANSQISVPGANVNALTSNIGDISTQASAQAALDNASSRIDEAASARGEIGASVARLDTAQNNISSSIEQTARARATIEDADVADTVARKVALEIKQNANTALLAQAGKLQASNAARLLA